MGYNDRQERVSADRTAREIPEEVVQDIIKDAEQTSVALQLGNVRRMNAYQTRFRLQNSFPGAFWINGDADDTLNGDGDGSQLAKDSAFKQTTKMSWTSQYLTPDELAVLVVMPDNWRDDSDIAWEEIRTALRTAFAKAIDKAILFGDSAFGALPASFGDGVVQEAVAAGNIHVSGTGFDMYDDYAATAQLLEEGGHTTNGFITGAGETWRLKRERDGNDRPLWDAVSLLVPGGITEVKNATWDRTEAIALAGDFEQLHIGIRQDMTISMSNSAPIFDPSDGSLIYTPFQQDGEVLRAVMRIGYEVTTPLKHLGGEYPFAVLAPVGYSS